MKVIESLMTDQVSASNWIPFRFEMFIYFLYFFNIRQGFVNSGYGVNGIAHVSRTRPMNMIGRTEYSTKHVYMAN